MKNIKNYLLFLAILLLLVCGIQYFIDYKYKKDNNDKISLLMKHQIDADVMVFGSSVAYVHFAPSIIQQITGMNVYNMGWDGLFFVQYNGLIKEYLSYQKKCKFVVIACDFSNLGKNDLITRPDLFYPYLANPNIYASLHEIEPDNMAKAHYLPGYKLTILGRTFYNHFIDKHEVDTGNGFLSRNYEWTGADTLKAFNARFDESVYENLKTTLNQITQKGIKVIIVMPPVYKEGYKLILNADKIKGYYQALTNNNVYFMDYTKDSLCNNKGFFYNNSHMNGIGATVFSNSFAIRLKKLMDSTMQLHFSGL